MISVFMVKVDKVDYRSPLRLVFGYDGIGNYLEGDKKKCFFFLIFEKSCRCLFSFLSFQLLHRWTCRRYSGPGFFSLLSRSRIPSEYRRRNANITGVLVCALENLILWECWTLGLMEWAHSWLPGIHVTCFSKETKFSPPPAMFKIPKKGGSYVMF